MMLISHWSLPTLLVEMIDDPIFGTPCRCSYTSAVTGSVGKVTTISWAIIQRLKQVLSYILISPRKKIYYVEISFTMYIHIYIYIYIYIIIYIYIWKYQRMYSSWQMIQVRHLRPRLGLGVFELPGLRFLKLDLSKGTCEAWLGLGLAKIYQGIGWISIDFP